MLCWVNFKSYDVRVSYNYIRVTSVLRSFCFYISKGPGHRQSPWVYSVRPQHYLWFLVISALTRLLNWGILVYPAIVVEDSIHLILFSWLLIFRKAYYFATSITRHDSSTVSSIAYITHIVNYQTNDCAWATTVYLTNVVLLRLSEF
jgi:hypothetical protein